MMASILNSIISKAKKLIAFIFLLLATGSPLIAAEDNSERSCSSKILVVGHVYSIIYREYENKKGEKITSKMKEARMEVLSDLKKEYADAIVFTGDLTQKGSQEEHEILKSFVEELGIPAFYVPGNHDISSDKRQQVYLNNIGYFERAVNLKCTNLYLLDSANGAWDRHSARMGSGLSKKSILLLQNATNKNSNKFNFAFMHQTIFESDLWSRDTLGLFRQGSLPKAIDHPDEAMPTAEILELKFKENAAELFSRKIDAVFTGDYHSSRPSSVMSKNGVLSYNLGFHFIESDSSIGRPNEKLKYHVIYIEDDHFSVYVRTIAGD